ncbi:CRISPR-associated endonuclease Cas2, partial [Patescibacteria group bacterium]
MKILISEEMKKKKNKIKKIVSPTKRKVILLLQAGFALGLTPSPMMHFYIFKELSKEWKDIDRQYLYRIIREFYRDRLVEWKEKADGSIQVVLSEEGKKRAFEFKIDEMEIKKPNIWDGKWRLVLFDVPEKRRNARDALRNKLQELGFRELQKSVFVFPYPCRDEIDFVVEF